MRRVLILQDDRPGHFYQSEGIALALARRFPVEIARLSIQPRRLLPLRILRFLFSRGLVGPRTILRLAYRGMPADPGAADIVISAGGETALANSALSRLFGYKGVFSGSLRGLPPHFFAAVLSPYRRLKSVDRHIIYLKPSPVDPDLEGPTEANLNRSARTQATVLFGGPSGTHKYDFGEWQALIEGLAKIAAHLDWHWTIVTSRRTPALVAERLRTLADADPDVFELIDFSSAGPGSAFAACIRAELILVTEDSNSMITEAVVSRNPVIAVQPRRRRMSVDEEGYLEDLCRSGWLRRLPIGELSADALDRLLAEITPMRTNHLDDLGGLLVRKLNI